MRIRKCSFIVAAAAAAAVGLSAPRASAVTPVTAIAIEGQTLPGSGAATVTTVNTAFVSGNNKVGFLGILSDNARFIYFDNGIVFKSTDVPSPVLTGGEGSIGVSDTGGFAYSPSIDGGDGIWSHIGKLARDDDPAPGLPGLFLTFNSRPTMTSDGTAYWVAGTTATQGGSTTGNVLYRATTTGGTPTYTPVLKDGDFVGGVAIAPQGIEFAYNVSDDGGQFINEVTLAATTATDNAVVLKGDTIVAREGFATNEGDLWQALDFGDVNNAGNWIVYGDTNAATNDDVLVYNGNVVSRQGKTIGGVTLGATLDAAAINDNNEIIQIWDLTSTSDEGLFWGHASDIDNSVLLLRTGDQLDVNGDNVPDYTLSDFGAASSVANPLDFGEDGLVYLDVDLTPFLGGDEVQAIIAVAVPEPGALSLLGLGALALVRRRK